MDLFGTIEDSWLLGLPVAVLLGALLGASPLTWPILAAAVGTRAAASPDTANRSGRTAVLALGAGLTLVYATLGLAAGSLDRFIREVLGAWTGVTYAGLAAVTIVAGAALHLPTQARLLGARVRPTLRARAGRSLRTWGAARDRQLPPASSTGGRRPDTASRCHPPSPDRVAAHDLDVQAMM